MNWEVMFADLLAAARSGDGLGPAAELLALGGPVVAVLAVLSVVMVAVTLLKLFQFARNGVGRHGRAQRAVERWLEGDAEGARREAAGGTLSQSVVATQLAAGGMGPEAREEAESLAALRLHELRSLVGLLDTIAQLSPLLGLFGTVLGMIEAFQALEGAGAAVDPSVLAGGIWVALLTTAVGLAVAMPASVIAGFFDARLDSERVALDTLISRLATGTARPAPTAGPVHGRTMAGLAAR